MINYSNPPDKGERYPRNDVKLPGPKTLNCAIFLVFINYNLQTEDIIQKKYLLPLVSYQGGFL